MSPFLALSFVMGAATFGAGSFCCAEIAAGEQTPLMVNAGDTATVHRIITRQYEAVLGRRPDPSGLATFSEALLVGGKDERWLHEVLSRSPEAVKRARHHRPTALMAALVLLLGALSIWFPQPLRRAIAPLARLCDCVFRRLPGMVPASWTSFCVVLACVFLLRALFFLCAYPPLEGFDEHQHLAYLVYLDEQGDAPQYGKATIPKSLYADFVSNPHSTYGWQQLGPIGALRYEDYYQHRATPDYTVDVRLSSAFHPPLYYRALSPLFARIARSGRFREAVYAVRIASACFAALSLFFFVVPLKSFFGPGYLSRLGVFTVSLSPMYLVYSVRVSPDALALLITALLFFILATFSSKAARAPLGYGLMIGSLLGIGTLTRASVILWVPVALLFVVTHRSPEREPLAGRLLLCGVIVLTVCAVTAPHFIQNMLAYGQAVPGQEGLRMAAMRKGPSDLVRAVTSADAWDFLVLRMLKNNLWTSGWLFLAPRGDFVRVYFWLMSFCLLGFLPWVVRGVTQNAWRNGASNPLVTLCGLGAVFTLFGAYLHALSSRVAYGHVITPPYYLMPAFLPFLALALRLGQQWPGRRIWIACTGLLGVLFLWTEIDSLFFVAAPQWTNTNTVGEMMTRLSLIHPFFPSPAWMPAMAVALGSLLFLLLVAIRRHFVMTELAEPPPDRDTCRTRRNAASLAR